MKILVAVDGSSCSSRAIDYVSSRVWGENDQFLVLSVVGPIPAELPFVLNSKDHESVRDRLYKLGNDFVENATSRLSKAVPQHKIEGKVLNGPTAETICKMAFAWNADLIVIGSHGRQGFSHFLLGSVAEEVLRHSPCSVEIVKDKRDFVMGVGPQRSKIRSGGKDSADPYLS